MQSSTKKDFSIKAVVPGRENKPHIGIFGRCNAGKSSLLNFITGAETAIVSPKRGTTTDIVRKSYEILDFAPVVFLDTAGVDDYSPLGCKRVARTLDAIGQIDLALLVFREWGAPEEELAARFRAAAVPFVAVSNTTSESREGQKGPDTGKSGETGKETPSVRLCGAEAATGTPCRTNRQETGWIEVDAKRGNREQLDTLLGAIKRMLPKGSYRSPSMFEGRISAGDAVLLVCPIDSEAPAGRLILPQVQAIRELLDRHAVPVVIQPAEIGRVFAPGEGKGTGASITGTLRPKLVVADSQVLPEVRAAVPEKIEVTSFSILLAAAKGDYNLYRAGLEQVDKLRSGDRILIAESCTHQVSCADIGRVKIPRWLEAYTGLRFEYTVVSGLAPLPDDLPSYALMVQCGGCMVTRSQLQNRIRQAATAGVAVTNYGMLIRKIRTEKA